MSDNTAREQLTSTMSQQKDATSDSSAQSSCARDTPTPGESTQSSAISVADGKEPQTVGYEEGPSRPITPRPASTWPKASKEVNDKQDLDSQLAKDKIYIKTALGNHPSKPKHGSQSPEPEEGSVTPVAPDQGLRVLTKEEFQKIYQREAKVMTQRLEAREIQRMCNPTPSNDAKFSGYWEQELLPRVVRILEEKVQGAYHINVRMGDGPDERVIDLVTKGNCAKQYGHLLESAKNEILPEEFSTKTRFDFRGGKRIRCVDGNGSYPFLQSDRSTILEVRNPRHYGDPVIPRQSGR
ncbi:hypothetical protein PG994_015012 [Apiospora phragmitis]|uniref:Uncharacterized protein n=1 Tax=Apiospora phragmitis TaxID=2905665 RepID=A0ABR1SV89_9PEZI